MNVSSTFFPNCPIAPLEEMSRTYDLTCTDCPFTTVVDGDTDDVYDAIDAHQAESTSQQADHFVTVEARAAPPQHS